MLRGVSRAARAACQQWTAAVPCRLEILRRMPQQAVGVRGHATGSTLDAGEAAKFAADADLWYALVSSAFYLSLLHVLAVSCRGQRASWLA